MILLKNGSYYEPTDADYIAWQKAYPGIDVHTEVLAAGSWCDANPSKRKLNGKRFVVNWLKRAQGKGGSPMAKSGPKSTRSMTMDEMFSRDWA